MRKCEEMPGYGRQGVTGGVMRLDLEPVLQPKGQGF
jgi:hypothetical protein